MEVAVGRKQISRFPSASLSVVSCDVCPLTSEASFKNTLWINLLTPNVNCSWRTAPLTSKRSILYIYWKNIGTEYFKHGVYSPFFSLQNAVCFIILTYLVPVLFTFYIQGVLKLKNNSGAKRLLRKLVETLPFKTEGRWLDSRWGNCDFFVLFPSDRPVNARSTQPPTKIMYQGCLLEGKCDRCVGMRALPLSCADLSRNSGNLNLLEPLQ